MRLAPEEVQNVAGAQRSDRSGYQIALDHLQGGTVGEQDIAGVLALIDHPPVAGEAGAFDVGQQRIDQSRLPPEERRPVGVGEALAQRADRPEVIDLRDLVVTAPIADAGPVHLPRQPRAAVDVDLDLVRRPGLQAHVHPAECGIDPIQIMVQALARPADHLQAPGLPVGCDRE